MTVCTRLALDLGASKIAAFGPTGMASCELPRYGSAEREVAWVSGWIGRLVADPVAEVVISCAPEVDSRLRIARWPNRPYWAGVGLGDILGGLSRTKIRVVPDGTSAGLAEAGVRGLSDLVYIGLGTGVSAGVIHNGRAVPDDFHTMDLGHTVVERQGPPCACGARGCLQAIASAPAIASLVTAALGRDVGWDELPAVYESAHVADARRRVADALGTAGANTAALFQISHLVVGGRIENRLPSLVRDVRGSPPLARAPNPPTVLHGALGTDASIAGAARLAGLLSPEDPVPRHHDGGEIHGW